MSEYIEIFDKIRVDKKGITMFYGENATGKTTFAYYVMSKVKGKQLFIDTEGGFDIDRLKSICETDFVTNEPDEMTTKYFNKDYMIEVRNISTWFELNAYVKKRTLDGEEYDLIVIDSPGYLFRNDLVHENRKIQYEKRSILTKDLSQMLINTRVMIAKKKGIVIITNWRVSGKGPDGEEPKYPFLMGKTAAQLPKNIYELNYIDTGMREIVVYKAKNLPEGLNIQFKFTENGIEKV